MSILLPNKCVLIENIVFIFGDCIWKISAFSTIDIVNPKVTFIDGDFIGDPFWVVYYLISASNLILLTLFKR